MTWFRFWLILHILGVVVAFGPTFAFGLIAAYGQKHPRFALAAAEISHLIEGRMVYPVAVLVAVFGVALIVTGGHDLLKSEWLLIAIVLYLSALAFSIVLMNRWSNEMIGHLTAMSEGPPPEGPPPPEIPALGKKLQLGGILLSVIFLAILVLMVWKPGAAFR